MDSNQIIQEIVKIIRQYIENNYQIMLFGSWARGNAMETSDIDIGILGKEQISSDIMRKIRSDIENIPTLRGIDVVDLNSVEEKFKNKVLKYAKILK